jgi:PAS domain S-box-containing protein
MFDPPSLNDNNLYRELVESTNSIILRWDMEGRILFMNRYGLDLFGYSAQELVGKFAVGTILAEQESTGRDLHAMMQAILADPGQYQLNKNENTCKDGSKRWIQWSNRPIINSQGRCEEILSVGIDITPLELTRKQLEDNELRYQLLYETSHDAVLIFQDGIFTCCNKQAEKIFGCARKDIIGKTPLTFSSPVQPNGQSAVNLYRENIARLQQGKRTNFEWYFRKKDGEERIGEVNINPIKTSSMDYVQISIQDKTEQKRLEQELRQHQKMEAIGTLAGGIAHDFNNILTAIMGFTEIALKKLGPDSPAIDDLRQVRTASKRARDLIRQILTFSRKSPHSRQPIQLRLIIQEAVRLLRSSFPSTITIEQHLESDAFVNADPTQMHQVIMNLGTNALHAMEDTGGRLSITLTDVQDPSAGQYKKINNKYAGKFIRLEVRDTGKGIAPETLGKIFDPYFTTKKQSRGSGMGLAVVHGIIESHNGTIDVQSKSGKGTMFTLFLPVSEPLKQKSPDSKDENLPSRKCDVIQPRIMFVDDEATLRDLTSELLVSQGYQVRTFVDGVHAWEAFEAAPESWDLIITDQTMPRMTGVELITKIRTRRPQMPVLLSTGYSDSCNPAEMEHLGVTEILQKPSSLKHLLETVQNALAGQGI